MGDTMKRLLAAATFLAAGAFVPANAQDINVADCAVFGEIAQDAVAFRADGKGSRLATRRIARGFKGDQARFKDAVPLLVDFVYGLPPSQLRDDVGATYQAACEAQG